jgi:hypothetical protein
MFAPQTFKPTLTGPVQASGRQARVGRNSALQNSAFAGNERAYQPKNAGVRAGGAMARYRSGMEADTQAAKGYSQAQQLAMTDDIFNQNALNQYQSLQSQEQSALRELLLGGRKVREGSAMDLRELALAEDLAQRQRDLQNQVANYQRKASVGGILAGIF